MSIINDQEKQIYQHILSIFDLLEKSQNELEKSNKKMDPTQMDQEEFNDLMKDKMISVLDYLGTRIGRRALTKEFGIHIG